VVQEDGAPKHDEAHQRIGEKLRSARIAAGMTAEQLSESTRITLEVLQRVEAGQFAECGGDIYARGHIRTYARAVGLDPEPLLAEYGEIHLPPLTKRDLRRPRVAPQPPEQAVPGAPRGAQAAAARRARSVLPTIVPGAMPSLVPMAGATPPPDVPPLTHERRGDFTDADAGSASSILDAGRGEPAVNERPAAFLGGAKDQGRSGPNWSIALVGALVAVGVVAAVQLWPGMRSRASHTAAGSSASHGAPVAPVAPAPVLKPAASIDVRVSAHAATWLGITNSAGKQLYWNVIQQGQTQEFSDPAKLDVIVGDAASVDIIINGKPQPTVGASGQVFHATYEAESSR
jgi:transcriptional regulator with XRE-family HTH domain